MRDAGISEQSFQIRLRQRGEISVDQREQRDHNEQPLCLRQHQERLQNAQQHDKAGRFRTDREKRGHRRRRALINIRHPDLKRHGRDLETERDENEHHAEERCAAIGCRDSPAPP